MLPGGGRQFPTGERAQFFRNFVEDLHWQLLFQEETRFGQRGVVTFDDFCCFSKVERSDTVDKQELEDGRAEPLEVFSRPEGGILVVEVYRPASLGEVYAPFLHIEVAYFVLPNFTQHITTPEVEMSHLDTHKERRWTVDVPPPAEFIEENHVEIQLQFSTALPPTFELLNELVRVRYLLRDKKHVNVAAGGERIC